MTRKKGHFKQIRRTRFDELFNTPDMTLPESDLCFQNDDYIVQLEFVEPDNPEEKYEIKPGPSAFSATNTGVKLNKIELRTRDLLTSAMNTQLITSEARTFFSRLHVYETLKRQKKRSLLLYSKPGMGKTSSIIQFCDEAIKEDQGTVVINWPTGEVESDSVATFLNSQSEYVGCSRLVLIIEDIGGGEREGSGGPRGVDSSLLNLLDGIDVTFKLPTFIIATTNYPENLLSALADRPGRFDLMLELQAPKYDEKIQLLEFIARRTLTDDERVAFKDKEVEEFSIAHLEECIIRSMLHDKPVGQVVKELVEHKKRFANAFEKNKKGLGFGGRHDDDDD